MKQHPEMPLSVPPPLPVTLKENEFPENSSHSGCTGSLGILQAAVPRKRRSVVNPTASLAPDGSKIIRYYFRAPPGKQLPDGIPNRLPDDPRAAETRARELVALCIPYRLQKHGPGYKGRIDELALEVAARAKKRSKTRDLPYLLTDHDVLKLLVDQEYRCALTGIRFKADAIEREDGSRAPYRPSLDRINCKVGYLPGNVRFVLVAVNIALSDWGEDVFYHIAEAMADRRRRLEGPLE